MGKIIISDLDDALMTRLLKRAETNDRTLEEEAKCILVDSLPYVHAAPENLADAIRSLFEPLGGAELELPERATVREAPNFDQLQNDDRLGH